LNGVLEPGAATRMMDVREKKSVDAENATRTTLGEITCSRNSPELKCREIPSACRSTLVAA
jgi:hypothetical protein